MGQSPPPGHSCVPAAAEGSLPAHKPVLSGFLGFGSRELLAAGQDLSACVQGEEAPPTARWEDGHQFRPTLNMPTELLLSWSPMGPSVRWYPLPGSAVWSVQMPWLEWLLAGGARIDRVQLHGPPTHQIPLGALGPSEFPLLPPKPGTTPHYFCSAVSGVIYSCALSYLENVHFEMPGAKAACRKQM